MNAVLVRCYVIYMTFFYESCSYYIENLWNERGLSSIVTLHCYLNTPLLCASLSSASGHASANSSASAKLLLRKVVYTTYILT